MFGNVLLDSEQAGGRPAKISEARGVKRPRRAEASVQRFMKHFPELVTTSTHTAVIRKPSLKGVDTRRPSTGTWNKLKYQKKMWTLKNAAAPPTSTDA